MAIANLLRPALFTLVGFAALAASSVAHADEDFDVKLAPGKVTIVAKGKWHINKDYPWALVVGEKKVTDFKLEEKSAVVDAPKGAAHVKGGICNGDQCRMLKVEVDVP
ncbi:MAG TPA: hypothetical protein VH062_17130 [Polyangiaceae bacterium]|jgi:hypothetical protein|nr:hypothetical protein [Polyangiaceae bacterium]